MKSYFDSRITLQLLSISLVVGLGLPSTLFAAQVKLVSQPMATTTTSNVKPNLMFIFDDSGSMEYDRLPDYANVTDPRLRHNAAYNGMYYHPAITYTPPVFFNADGTQNTTTYPSKTSSWTTVKNDGYGVLTTGTSNLVGNASFYTMVPGEYCDASDLKNCIAATAPSGSYIYPARFRWCTTATIADMAPPTTAGKCQAIRTSTFKYERYPKPRSATISISGSSSTSLSSISAGGKIISDAIPASSSSSTLANNIANAINACSATIVSPCTTSGFSATVSGSVVTIYANAPGAFSGPTFTKSGSMSVSTSSFSGGNSVPGSNRFINIIPSIVSYPYPGSTTKEISRTDCAGTTCTYNEEMTNFANWWTYYRTRVQAMKSSVSRAFKSIDNRYRVGYSTICDKNATDGASFLGNQTFELAHKNNWYKTLFATKTTCWTPLRGALSKAGRYYANKVGDVDPVQYSCQQNFSILSTDGYWNTDVETSTYGPYGLTGASVGNLDGGTTPRPLKEGTTAVSNTLADVAKYYYDKDLRDTSLGNCAGGSSPDYPSGNPDVCTNNVFTSTTDSSVQQHMTTFTMGLGADGTLNFTTDYADATSGDFYKLKTGTGSPTVNWPDPIAGTGQERIDDLWHAAINGRGEYFSAKDPEQIVKGFTKALSSITAKLGSASAAATSTLTPTASNNKAYVASYTTSSWKGNLESRAININTGAVSSTATWCVENVPISTCATPLVANTSGASTIYNCITSAPTAGDCTGVYDSATSTCATEVANACTGTMTAKVGATTDTRTIYTADPNGSGLVAFDAAYAISYPDNFSAAHVNALNQWSTISGEHTGVKLINYLRGQTGYEQRASNATANQLYRVREATMGDVLESQPAYIGPPVFDYSDPTYIAFKSAQSGRSGTVYVGANDGMLHAINADTGVERWAYVPSMVIPNMWKLASTDYSSNHVNFVNGSVTISDIKGAGGWRTILVGGLNGGGRGYYALDITNPAVPTLLWELTPSQDADLGYTFGVPVVTTIDDGTWVVLVTSGYNNGTLSSIPVTPATDPVTYVPNSPAGNGKGNLYVLNASTGAVLKKITNSAGTTASPSGLAQLVAWNNDSAGNLAGDVYGGDLQGNLWRFDVNAGSYSLFATLSDGANSQPITTTPVLGMVSNKHVVFVGTGKYLENSDLSTTQTQSLYAIKDDGTAVGSPRSHTGSVDKMVKQTILNSGSLRSGTKNTVDFKTDRGWFVDFPDISIGASPASERVNIDMQLVAGTLIVPTIVPASTACSPGGYGWLSFFNYANGWPVGSSNDSVSLKFDSSIVGVNVIMIQNKPVVEVITSSNPTPELPKWIPPPLPTFDFFGQRSTWREF
ncbi:MAG: PilC/PilY family type IV pilus protein [Sideroxyarcus sp.]|nr:PilC/PilY family type IV pilus protein [Sideroxyarcus sp.]